MTTTPTKKRRRGKYDAERSMLHAASVSGFDEIEWIDADAVVRSSRPTPQLLQEPFETNIATRTGVQFQNRLNRHVNHFWAPTGSYLWCESAFEHDAATGLEYRGDIHAISAQPFRILFAGSTPGLRSHDPDFFGLRNDGTAVVVDVKPRTYVNAQVEVQFAATRDICDRVGWAYEVVDEVSPARSSNLANLRRDRLARAHPGAEVIAQALSVFADGRPLGEGRLMLNRRHPALAMPVIKHLLWHHLLQADLNVPLSLNTLVTANPEAEAISCRH